MSPLAIAVGPGCTPQVNGRRTAGRKESLGSPCSRCSSSDTRDGLPAQHEFRSPADRDQELRLALVDQGQLRLIEHMA